MADSHEESDSAADENQLTIRIPNPKVYLARQSMWIGRRGKPRCDHCRLKNLKCDRVLPTCNHCSWANGRECKYTPLPTPAHRGIPRCDRCRLKNLKCDRNLPVCNHCSDDNETECNYTPKKRHKVPSDHGTVRENLSGNYGKKAASFLVSDVLGGDDQDADHPSGNDDYADHRHSFYGQNIASTSTRMPHSLTQQSREESPEPMVSRYSQSIQLTPEYPGHTVVRRPSGHVLERPLPVSQLSFIPHTLPQHEVAVSQSPLEPWSHPNFAPLPEIMLRRLSTVNSVEMPCKSAFEESLAVFLSDLGPELQETAAFSPEIYTTVAESMIACDMHKVSERLRTWISFHHICSGSNKYSLLLVPREEFFDISSVERERLRTDYVARMDEKYGCPRPPFPHARDIEAANRIIDSTRAFDRLPVLPQIYDILVFAHRSHESSSSMVTETQRSGVAMITWPMAEMFVRLCPLCNLRSKPGQYQGCHVEVPASNCLSGST